MSIARRSFLKSATMTTLSAGLALCSAQLIFGQRGMDEAPRPPRRDRRGDAGVNFPIPIEVEQDARYSFKAATFTPYVGDFFQAPNALGEMISLELIRVTEYKMPVTARARPTRARQPYSFTLTFSASEQLPPFTSIHKLSHPALGEFDLFLTSREADDGTLIYEAVFNHIF